MGKRADIPQLSLTLALTLAYIIGMFHTNVALNGTYLRP